MTTLRSARPDDYPIFERLFPELQTGDRIPPPGVWADEIAPSTSFAELDGQIVGYVFAQILEGVGYIRHVVVDPDRRGQGLGRVLLDAVARRCRAAGCSRWCLNVKPDNVPAVRLYEAMGMRLAYSSAAVRMHWEIVERLPELTAPVRCEPLPASSIEEAERALELPAGLIGRDRSGRKRILYAFTHERILGLAAFDPQFPGAYPFRVHEPAIVRPLLEAMRLHRDPNLDFVQLVLEDAQDVLELLVEQGAWIHLAFDHFEGPVPSAS